MVSWFPARWAFCHFPCEMSGECMLLGSVSSQQRFGAMDIKALGVHHSSRVLDKPCYIALRQISVTALFYLDNSRRIHPRSVRACQPKDAKRREWRSTPACGREREHALAPLFICFSLPLGLPAANWASQECCWFYLRSSLRSSDLPLFYFHGLFPSLSFSYHHSGLLFSTLTA